MNSTIVSVNDGTMDMRVSEFTKKMIANKGKKFRCQFEKKDGTIRDMIFSPRTGWNEVFGIEGCASGRKMITTKVGRDIITVNEIIEEGKIQPRSISLRKVITLDVI